MKKGVPMLRLFSVFVLLLSFVGTPLSTALAYEEAKIDQVMGELETANSALFKKAEKVYASGTEGKAARLVMLFKFSGKKYKVIEDYARAKKCKKFQVCAPWEKVN